MLRRAVGAACAAQRVCARARRVRVCTVPCAAYAGTAAHRRWVHRAAWQERSERHVALRQAVAANDADAVYDAFLLAAQHDAGALGASEFREVLRVLLDARPRTRIARDRILSVVEHVKRARRAYAHVASPVDALVHAELSALLSGAYVWNALLASARVHQRRVPLAALEDTLDVFIAAEAVATSVRGESAGALESQARASLEAAGSSVPSAAASMPDGPPWTPFPDTVSYNMLLHTLVRCIPLHAERPLRARRAAQARMPTLLGSLRRELRARPLTPARAERFFVAVWERMVQSPSTAPSARSWNIRLLLYVTLGRLDKVRGCLAEMVRRDVCTIVGVNTALGAYGRAHANVAARTDVRSVYEALRYNQLCAERGVTPPAYTDETVSRVLGVPCVPAHIVPDGSTFAIVIRVLAMGGDLDGALDVLHDLVVTPMPGHAAPPPDVYYALFAAYARHGAATHGTWNARTLDELLAGYLRAGPTHTPTPRQLYTVLQALRRVGSGRGSATWIQERWARLEQVFSARPDFCVGARVRHALAEALG